MSLPPFLSPRPPKASSLPTSLGRAKRVGGRRRLDIPLNPAVTPVPGLSPLALQRVDRKTLRSDNKGCDKRPDWPRGILMGLSHGVSPDFPDSPKVKKQFCICH